MRSGQILYIFVLRAEMRTYSLPAVIQKKHTKFATSHGYILRILQHFAGKLRNFINFSSLFPKIPFLLLENKIDL